MQKTNESLLQEAMEQAHQRGKQPFDIDRFLRYFHPATDRETVEYLNRHRDDPAAFSSSVRGYYLHFPEIMTPEDYAIHLNRLDALY